MNEMYRCETDFYQVFEKLAELVLLVGRNDVHVFQEQLVRVADLLKTDVNDRLGNQRCFGILKRKYSVLK